jgi:site-specific recombinase XerD
LFLKFAAEHQKTPVKELEIKHLTADLIFSFLDHLETTRHNSARTRNTRLAAIKSFAKMIGLLYPEHRKTADMILSIPQKRYTKNLIGFFTHDEIETVFASVDLRKKEGLRDLTILNLLYDTGARASEVTTIKKDDFDPVKKTLALLGKGNRYRIVTLWPITTSLIRRYIQNHRQTPKIEFCDILFVNQRGQALTRHGIHRICKKYLKKSFPEKRLKNINPAHSFRHSCAVNLLLSGASLTEIKNQLGHENLNSTMVYLHMNVLKKREVQKRFIEYTRSSISENPKLDEWLDWENKKKILDWLDNL